MLEWLNTLGGFGVAGAVIHQSIRHVRNGRIGALFTYAIPTFLVISMLSLLPQVQVLAVVAAFIYGWQAYGRGAWREAFLFFSVAIFLLAGTLVQVWLSEQYHLLIGVFLLAPLLIVFFYALRQQLRRMPRRRAAGKSRLANWAAIFGLWTLVFIGAGGVLAYLPAEFKDYHEAYAEPESGQLLANVMAQYEVWQSVDDGFDQQSTFFSPEPGYYFEIKYGELFAEFETIDSTAEYVELYDADRQLALRLFATEAFYQNPGKTDWHKLFDGQWIAPHMPPEESGEDDAETESDAPLGAPPALDELQQLIGHLFSAETQIREEARRQLSARADPGLIPALIQYSRDNPDRHEGLWQALYLLERQSDEQLRPHQEAVLAFLDWMAQKGYGPATMGRIEALRERL
jgi:hypothetical protein